jgi:hypothetical protein
MNRTTPALAALAVLTLAGCGSTVTIPAASTSTPAAARAQAAPSPSPDCTSQMIAWRGTGGGLAQLSAVSGDLSGMGTASDSLEAALGSGSDASTAESALQSAASSLQSDDAAAEGNLPPSCVPGLRSDEGDALTDYSKAAGDAQNAVSELGSGSYAVADGDLTACSAAEAKGTAKLQAASRAITTYTNGS